MKGKKTDDPNFENASDLQTGFAVGYVYHRVKQELDHIGATSGGKVSAADAAAWLGKLLLSEARRGVLDGTEPLPQVWRTATKRHAQPAPAAKVHVHARDKQALKFPETQVTCRLCGTPSKNRREYMIHRNTVHPEQKAKQVAAMRKAQRAIARTAKE